MKKGVVRSVNDKQVPYIPTVLFLCDKASPS